MTGASIGIRTSTNGTALTTVTTTSTNTRSIHILNGQLYYSTGSGTQGVYQVGIGKPTSASTTSTNLTTSTGAYGFAISPDFLTLYTNSTANTISRFTYSGTYSAGVYSGGSWSTASTGFTLTAATGLAVDWSGYTFSTGANGAIIYASNTASGASMLVRANDNGTGAMTTTTLASVTGNNIFKQLAFSPIKQTLTRGGNTPATGSLTQGTSNAVLFQFNVSADEGNSTIRRLMLNQAGTATIGTGSSINNLRLVYDVDGDGMASAAEINAAFTTTGTVTGSNITFSGLSQTYINEGSSNNYLVIGDIAQVVQAPLFLLLFLTEHLTELVYTTNLVNAGGSYVTIGNAVPTGNTLTIAAGASPSITHQVM
jgi:hypothetical protein